MSKLFLVPKTDEVKADAPRPLSAKERKLLRGANGGDATVAQLGELADKFGRRFDAKASKRTKVNGNVFTLVEVVDFTPEDAA